MIFISHTSSDLKSVCASAYSVSSSYDVVQNKMLIEEKKKGENNMILMFNAIVVTCSVFSNTVLIVSNKNLAIVTYFRRDQSVHNE